MSQNVHTYVAKVTYSWRTVHREGHHIYIYIYSIFLYIAIAISSLPLVENQNAHDAHRIRRGTNERWVHDGSPPGGLQLPEEVESCLLSQTGRWCLRG